MQDEEHVWFDDDLPADAETERPWRWSTARAFTGLKSFTFGRDHQPFGFTTRLNPLDVPAAGMFYLMVWLDAADPPGRIDVALAARQSNPRIRVGREIDARRTASPRRRTSARCPSRRAGPGWKCRPTRSGSVLGGGQAARHVARRSTAGKSSSIGRAI